MKEINKIIFALCLLLLAVFPFGAVIRFSPISNLNIYPQDIIVGLLSAVLLVFFIIKKPRKYKNILLSAVVFNIIAIISLLVSSVELNYSELFISASYLLRFDAYLFLIFLGMIAFSKAQIKTLKKYFIYSSLLTVAFGFIQYFFYNNLRNLYYLGWDEHLYRMFSTFLDPNFAGVIFVLLSLLLFSRVINEKKINKETVGSFAAFILTILALILTYSRTALISLIVGISIILILSKKIKLLLISIIIFTGSVLIFSDFSVEGMNPIRIASSEARIESFKIAAKIFNTSPIIGIGFNAYRYAQIDKGVRIVNPQIPSNADSGTDNSVMFILATTGILGLISYFAIWGFIIKVSLFKEKKERIVFYSILISLFIASQFINALFYAPIMLWIFYYVGIFELSEN